MRIVHLAPFAPCRAGIYEAARDMARADVQSGHSVWFVDTGVEVGGKRADPLVGAVDDRAGFCVTTADPSCISYAEVIVQHTGVFDAWGALSQAPIVWIVHARPLAAFRPEQNRQIRSYSMYASVAQDPRVKAMVYFWSEFEPYWRVIFPPEKIKVFDWPPIDQERFSPEGERHIIEGQHLGRYNGLICDSWREDIDVYEAVSGAIEAARVIPGLKWHLYGFENPINKCWHYLIHELQKLGAMGEFCSRMPDMEKIYRGHDFLLTPHRIVTRVTGEALSCGLPIIASDGCKVAQHTADMSDPYSIAAAVEQMVADLDASASDMRDRALNEAWKFNLYSFGAKMTDLYREITEGQ